MNNQNQWLLKKSYIHPTLVAIRFVMILSFCSPSSHVFPQAVPPKHHTLSHFLGPNSLLQAYIVETKGKGYIIVYFVIDHSVNVLFMAMGQSKRPITKKKKSL